MKFAPLQKIKFGKIFAIVVITVLIWVWADLALDETLPDRPAVISVDQSANRKLWVTLNNAPSADIRLTLSGPHTAIRDISKELKEGRLLEFDLNVTQENLTEPRKYTLALLPFLQKDTQLKRRGLKITACVPDNIEVNVIQLVKKSLSVKCIDEVLNPVGTAIIEPAQVEAFVPEDWTGEELTALVQLTQREIEQARFSPLEKTPFVEFAAGQNRDVPATVKITAPPHEDPRKPETIQNVTMGFNSSAVLQGKYKVEVVNLTRVLSPIAILATPAAKQAYANMTYQVILEIYDSDVNAASGEPLRRDLIYNFPPEFLRKNEIQLNQQPVTAQFKLVPLAPEPSQ